MPVPPASASPAPEVVSFYKALADETRLAILRLLVLTDLRSGEIVERLQMPHNALSYHLKHLSALGLLHDRRSTADARDVYYSLDIERLQALYTAAGDALHIVPAPDRAAGEAAAGNRALHVLFLCTHNSARSQLAEGLMRSLGGDEVEVCSAGSAPSVVHPIALALLQEWGIDTASLAAKPLDQFVGQSFDYVITVCDRVREVCPTFSGDPGRIHWSLPDPTLAGDEAAQWTAFRAVQRELLTRIHYLMSVPHPVTGRRPAVHAHLGTGSAA